MKRSSLAHEGRMLLEAMRDHQMGFMKLISSESTVRIIVYVYAFDHGCLGKISA